VRRLVGVRVRWWVEPLRATGADGDAIGLGALRGTALGLCEFAG
jgi:hypothetical protein